MFSLRLSPSVHCFLRLDTGLRMAANKPSSKRAHTVEAAEAPVPGSTSPRLCSSDADLVLISSACVYEGVKCVRYSS